MDKTDCFASSFLLKAPGNVARSQGRRGKLYVEVCQVGTHQHATVCKLKKCLICIFAYIAQASLAYWSKSKLDKIKEAYIFAPLAK